MTSGPLQAAWTIHHPPASQSPKPTPFPPGPCSSTSALTSSPITASRFRSFGFDVVAMLSYCQSVQGTVGAKAMTLMRTLPSPSPPPTSISSRRPGPPLHFILPLPITSADCSPSRAPPVLHQYQDQQQRPATMENLSVDMSKSAMAQGSIASRFESQDQVDEARERKEQEWKEAYARYVLR